MSTTKDIICTVQEQQIIDRLKKLSDDLTKKDVNKGQYCGSATIDEINMSVLLIYPGGVIPHDDLNIIHECCKEVGATQTIATIGSSLKAYIIVY